MMLSRADFEDLLPDVFAPANAEARPARTEGPSAGCLARWEDDGGQPALSHAPDRAHAANAAQLSAINLAASAMAVAALGQSLAPGARRVMR